LSSSISEVDNFLDAYRIPCNCILQDELTFEISEYDFGKYPNVVRWYDNAKKVIPGWEENWEGCEYYKKLYLGGILNKQ